jgi:hypothetical protein
MFKASDKNSPTRARSAWSWPFFGPRWGRSLVKTHSVPVALPVGHCERDTRQRDGVVSWTRVRRMASKPGSSLARQPQGRGPREPGTTNKNRKSSPVSRHLLFFFYTYINRARSRRGRQRIYAETQKNLRSHSQVPQTGLPRSHRLFFFRQFSQASPGSCRRAEAMIRLAQVFPASLSFLCV